MPMQDVLDAFNEYGSRIGELTSVRGELANRKQQVADAQAALNEALAREAAADEAAEIALGKLEYFSKQNDIDVRGYIPPLPPVTPPVEPVE